MACLLTDKWKYLWPYGCKMTTDILNESDTKVTFK